LRQGRYEAYSTAADAAAYGAQSRMAKIAERFSYRRNGNICPAGSSGLSGVFFWLLQRFYIFFEISLDIL
jgi:hypothetical protein